MVTINEVGLRKDKKVSLNGYNCYTRNRKTDQNMGGVATAVVDAEKSSTLKIVEGENKDEFIITRHGKFQRAINCINYYGEQESRTDKIEIEERWARLTKIMKDIENNDEEAILIGDLNKLVGNDKSEIKNNNPKVSFGGKLILELITEGNYLLVNGSEKCRGGPFTRQEPNNPDVESCLDLVIVSRGLIEYIQELVIDKERKFTPHRAGKGKLIYTDHFSMHFILKGMPLNNPAMRKDISQVIWNTNKAGGWSKYKEITEDNIELKRIVEQGDEISPNDMMEKIEKITKKIKFQCFGKVQHSSRMERDKDLDLLYKEKCQASTDEAIQAVDTKIAGKLLEKQREEYESKLEYLKTLKNQKGKSAAIFKLKEKILGSKKDGMESVSMNDPVSGKMICDPEELKNASVKYLSNLLTNREPKEEYKQNLEIMKQLHVIRMSEEYRTDDKLIRKDFEDMIRKLKKKKAEKYKFTLNGGKSYRDSLFCLYKRVWDTEEKPTSWERTNCTMLYKGKGSKNEFGNQRFIHSKEEIPKCFEALVIEKVKPKIIQKCPKFQIGGLPGHQSAEHLFTLKSIIGLYLSQGKSVIVNYFDLKKYFDSEVLIDAMDNLYRSDIRGKLYRLIYQLNKNNLIQIKTPVGITKEFKTGENVTQGSVGGGLISSINLAIPVATFFEHSEHELYYGDVWMNPCIYQDDLARVADSVSSAQAGIDKIEACMETKLLDLHDEKSCFIIFGKGKQLEEMKTNLNQTPLKLYGKKMVQKVKEKYLGDYFHCDGLAASARATVEARAVALRSGAVEVRAIVEDCRSRCLGGLDVGLEMFEIAYIPALMNNSQTWIDIDKETIGKLDDLQYNFLRILLATPSSTPRAALAWDCGVLKMKFRIMQAKLSFLHYVLMQDEESLANQILHEQNKNGFPGLVKECQGFIKDLKILNPFQHWLSPSEWKRMVKTSIIEANGKELKDEILEKYKKLKSSDLAEEEFSRKSYLKDLSLQQARNKFKFRTSMTQHVKMNQENNEQYAAALWKCEECGWQNTHTHLLSCTGYEPMREGVDLECDKQLCDYLQKIFLHRNNKLIN